MAVMTLEEIRKRLMDRRIFIVSKETGLHTNTIRDIRDNEKSNPTYSTMALLSDYFSKRTIKNNESEDSVKESVKKAVEEALEKAVERVVEKSSEKAVENNVDKDRLLDTEDASIYLASIGYPIKKTTLSTYRNFNRGPSYQKIGGKVYYKTSDLAQWKSCKTKYRSYKQE